MQGDVVNIINKKFKFTQLLCKPKENKNIDDQLITFRSNTKSLRALKPKT